MPDPVQERHWAEEFFKAAGIQPSNLVMADKPDARFDWGGKRIGMEITRVDSQEYHRGRKLAAKHFPDRAYSTTGLCDDHGHRRTNDELVETMLSPEWESLDLAYDRWARACAGAEVTKSRKLNRTDYLHFDEDWLLITGVEGPGGNAWDVNFFPEFLFRALVANRRAPANVPPGPYAFHRVYFHFAPNLFLSADNRLRRLAPNTTT